MCTGRFPGRQTENTMLSKTLTGGLTAAAIAALSLMAFGMPASAAATKYSYGSWMNKSMMHSGRMAIQVCRTKYKVVYYKHAWHKIPDGQECHWTFPPMKPIKPLKPLHPLKKY